MFRRPVRHRRRPVLPVPGVGRGGLVADEGAPVALGEEVVDGGRLHGVALGGGGVAAEKALAFVSGGKIFFL